MSKTSRPLFIRSLLEKSLAVFVLAVPLGAVAQTISNAPAPATTAPAKPAKLPEPASATTPDNTRYLNDPNLTKRVEADVKAILNKPCDIIFIGDSITAGWLGAGKQIWAKEYAPRNALDFGIGGDKTQNVLWRLENMPVKGLTPKVAVILIGTNNHVNTPEEIAAGVKAILDKTQETFPGVKIILLSIMPRGGAQQTKNIAANVSLKLFANDKTIFYLDMWPVMPAVATTLPDGKIDTNYKGLGKDHLHPDASGYQIWHDAMEPLLSKLLAGG